MIHDAHGGWRRPTFKKTKPLIPEGPACRIFGSTYVKKVTGNLHIVRSLYPSLQPQNIQSPIWYLLISSRRPWDMDIWVGSTLITNVGLINPLYPPFTYLASPNPLIPLSDCAWPMCISDEFVSCYQRVQLRPILSQHCPTPRQQCGDHRQTYASPLLFT